jgi:hypothetical protein
MSTVTCVPRLPALSGYAVVVLLRVRMGAATSWDWPVALLPLWTSLGCLETSATTTVIPKYISSVGGCYIDIDSGALTINTSHFPHPIANDG